LIITNTKDIAAKYIKVLVHGAAGSGKTRLCGTTGGKTLIISAEAGLLSLRGQDIDVAEIKSMADLVEIYEMMRTDTQYEWVCLDSISEVAEVVLVTEKTNNKDPRKAYGEMNDQMTAIIRGFRDLPKNVYMSAKQERLKDDISGQLFFSASAPGQRIGQALPYFFDEVFAFHAWKDAEGNIQRALQTGRDNQYDAKDRSGALEFIEKPDLAHIYAKITNTTKGE